MGSPFLELMRLETTDSQDMIRKTVREFAEKEVAHRVRELDEKAEFDWGIFHKCGELGFAGTIIPKEYGGQGLDTVSYMIVVEELSRVNPGLGVTIAVHTSVGSYPIYAWGTEEQKRRYLPDLAAGRTLGGFALTEPNAGSDAAGLETVAVPEGDGYIINGAKVFITNGLGNSFIIMAKTDKDKGVKGITAFILDKSMKGFRDGQRENKMGIRTSTTTELIMENVFVPKENIIGGLGGGFKIAMKALDVGRMGIGAQAVGIAQGAYEAALNYSKEREQFGRPISKFQAISFMLADMATEIDAARLLVYHAADLKDRGRPYGKESAMAKLYASDTAFKVSSKAIQVFGGHGYSKRNVVERFFRDARITQIYEGTNEIQRMVIARHMLS
jgi:alkylation response protein AidB-like acyl-CoA dehydrogenase